MNKSNDEPLRELGSFPGGTGSDHYGVESCQCDMMRHETVGSAELAKFDKSHLAGRTLKIPVSIFIATSLLLISCGKPAPPRDFATMATLVKVGMTKEEVIQAIGKPDVNSLEDSSLKGQSSSGVFIFSYHDGLKHLIVSFANDKVVRRSNF